MKVDYKTKKLLSEEQVAKSQVEFAVESTSLELQSTLLATRKSLEEAKAALKELKCTYPLDIQGIVDKSLEIRDLEDGIKIVEALQKEFGF
jgi:hypothetical protein